MPATVYFNGDFVPAIDARVSIDDRAVRFGLGFFETFRTSGGRPHHWRFNSARLERACLKADLAMPAHFLARDEARLGEAVRRLLESSGLQEAVFRYTTTGGAEDDAPGESLTLRPLPAEAPESGIDLRVLALRRDNGEWLPRPKSLNYANALLGGRELAERARGSSDEGLFLSREGEFVVETTRQNVAWIVDGHLCFPAAALGPVEGTCLAWALGLGGPCRAESARLDEFARAVAVVVTNAVRGVTPVRTLWDENDRRPLGTFESATHPIVCSLRQQWRESLATTARG